MSIEKFSNTNLKDIEELESKFNVNLPKDYKEFLIDYNGGIVKKDEKNKVKIEGISTEVAIDVLYGVGTGSNNSDIIFWMNNFEDDILENAVIIGDDIMHGLIVLICEGEDKGVYYWDDSYNFEESSDESNMYFITGTFTEILDIIN